MKLEKYFILPNTNLLKLSKKSFFIGLGIAITYSFLLYSLFYLTKESIRYFSITDFNDLLVLSDEQTHFYNLIFALIATIFGQNECFNYWFNSPQFKLSRKRVRKNSIINDLNRFRWIFLFLFTKLSFVLGIYLSVTFQYDNLTYELYSNYKYLLFFLVIVLFLQTWNSFLLVFKTKGFKWLVISMMATIVVSFGFSKINLIDTHYLDKKILSKNPFYKYELELPESSVYKIEYSNFLHKKIFIAHTKENHSPVIILDNEEVSIEELSMKLNDWKKDQLLDGELIPPYAQPQLFIHKNVRIDLVNQVKEELSKLGFYVVHYSVLPKNNNGYINFAPDHFFSIRIQENSPHFIKLIKKTKNQTTNIISIKSTPKKDFLINNQSISSSDLRTFLKNEITKNPDCIVQVYPNDKMTFGNYFEIISQTKSIIDQLRSEYTIRTYSKTYRDLVESRDKKKVKVIRKKFPYRILNMTKYIQEELSKTTKNQQQP